MHADWHAVSVYPSCRARKGLLTMAVKRAPGSRRCQGEAFGGARCGCHLRTPLSRFAAASSRARSRAPLCE